MLEFVGRIISDCTVIMSVALIARFVFLEPQWKKSQYVINIVFITMIEIIGIWMNPDSSSIACMIFAGINICIARERHRIRGFFLLVPILGICMGLIAIIIFVPSLFFPAYQEDLNLLPDLGLLAGMFVLLWKLRKSTNEQNRYMRQLQNGERRLVILVGMMLLGYITSLEGMAESTLTNQTRALILLCSVIATLLSVAVIGFILLGNKKSYFENVAMINQNYLNAEVRHFQAYQQMQTETRRIRHDMKNHMNAMLYLAQQEKSEELKQYLQQLADSVQQINTELSCGNSLADAICNEKNQIAKQNGIRFEISGKMPERIGIEPLDICTIFANALDNALEAVQKIAPSSRWMKLNISIQEDILLLTFTNPFQEDMSNCGKRKTTKPDDINHGFGIQNIELAAKKYNGMLRKQITALEDQLSIFTLEIMLFTTNLTPSATK